MAAELLDASDAFAASTGAPGVVATRLRPTVDQHAHPAVVPRSSGRGAAVAPTMRNHLLE
jgi:hypothetical protein